MRELTDLMNYSNYLSIKENRNGVIYMFIIFLGEAAILKHMFLILTYLTRGELHLST